MQRYFGLEKRQDEVILNISDIHHIKHVMRMKNHDQIEVVIDDELFLCCIENVNDEIKIFIQEKIKQKVDFMKSVILVLPLLKEQKMDFVLQKATELGVSEIVPVIMKRSIVKINDKEDKKLKRWNIIMKEASEQCMRNCIPKLHSITTLEELKNMDGLKMICSTTEEKNTFKKFLQTSQNYDTLIIVVGPEGGIDPEEEQELCKSGFVPVSLGPRIMRVETVPIYVLSILNYEYME